MASLTANHRSLNRFALRQVEEVLFTEMGQRDLVVWKLHRLIDSARFVKMAGKANEGLLCVFKSSRVSKRPEGF
jgi:hypothetical protein